MLRYINTKNASNTNYLRSCIKITPPRNGEGEEKFIKSYSPSRIGEGLGRIICIFINNWYNSKLSGRDHAGSGPQSAHKESIVFSNNVIGRCVQPPITFVSQAPHV